MDLSLKLEGMRLEDLIQGGAKLGFVSASELLLNDIRLDGSNAGGLIGSAGVSVKLLLGTAASFEGESIKALRGQNADMKGASVSSLLERKANFEGASVKWLKDSGANFAGVTYLQLRGAGCDFSGFTRADFEDLRKDVNFFKETRVSDLLNTATLNLAGWRLVDLPGARSALGGLPVAQVLSKGLSLSGLGLDQLIGQHANFSGAHILKLSEAKLAISDLQFDVVLKKGISFEGARVRDLPAGDPFRQHSRRDGARSRHKNSSRTRTPTHSRPAAARCCRMRSAASAREQRWGEGLVESVASAPRPLRAGQAGSYL